MKPTPAPLPPAAAAPPRRGLRTAILVLAPLVLALLYAAAHPLLAAKPDLSNVVPEGAVLSHRFRDLATVDRAFWWFGRQDPRRGRVGDRLGAIRNVPGLAGVDRSAPFHWVLLPREGRVDATMAIFALADAEEFRSTFEDPRLLELGHLRHAQHLAIRGRYAAVAWDAEAVRRLGTGDLAAEDRGEQHALAADVPGTLRYALLSPTDSPWREILRALGYANAKAVVVREGETPVGLGVPAGRVFRVMSAWGRLRAWFFEPAGERPGRIAVEVEAEDGALRASLASVGDGAGWRPPGVPTNANAWLWVPTGEARAALARVLFLAGVDLPAEVAAEEGGPFATSVLRAGKGADGGLFVWAEASLEAAQAWTIGIASPGAGLLPDLTPWVADWPPAGAAGVDLPPGAAPLTVFDASSGRPAPAGRAVLRNAEDLRVAALGPEAPVLLDTIRQGMPFEAPPAPTGRRLVAAFFLDEARARKILGAELEERGLLAVLAGGAIEGSVSTDGTRVHVEVRRAVRP